MRDMKNKMTPEIADSIIDMTLRQGGGTFDSTGAAVTPESGYAVGTIRGTYMAITPSSSSLAYGAFSSLIRLYKAEYFGTWYHNGLIYIDPVAILDDRKEAEALGRLNGQKAIYDFASQREIRL